MIIDLVVIVFLIIEIIIGRNRGLAACLISILSLVIALVLAILFYKPVGNFVMENTQLDDNLENVIYQNIPMSDTEVGVENDSKLPTTMKTYINNKAQTINEEKEKQMHELAANLTVQIVYIVAFVAIFLVAKIVLRLLKFISKLANKIPGLKQINHVGGAICGFIEGLITMYIIFAVISAMSPILVNTPMLEQIDKSVISKEMYNNNLVVEKITGKQG